MRFYKRDPDRALAGMAELSLKQRGAYNSLIDLLYARDGDVPDDDRRVAKMIGCHWREWGTAKKELITIGKVWVEGGKLHAKRVQETLKEAADFSQEQRKRVSERWTKAKNTNENNATVIPAGNTSTPTAIETPIEKKDSEVTEFLFPKPSSSSTTPRASRGGVGAKSKGLPDWINPEAWEAYVEMRKKIRAPLTDKAIALEVGTLTKLRASGQDPTAVMEEAVRRSWRGLFPLKANGHGNGNGHAPAFEQTDAHGWMRRLEVFYGKTSSAAGAWVPSWAAKPLEAGNRVPDSAWAAFIKAHGYDPRKQSPPPH